MSLKKIIGITLLLIIILPLASSESNDNFTVKNEDPEMTNGDYFLYDVDMSLMIGDMESDENIVEVVVNSNSGMRMEYGGDSCLQTGWEDCSIGLMYWNLNITIVYDEGVGVDNDRAIMEMRTESTIVVSGLHSEDTTVREMEMWLSIDGENYHSESIDTEVSTSTKLSDKPELVAIGDVWSVETQEETITNSKSRMNGESWEHEDEIIENSTEYETSTAVSVSELTTNAGNFVTMKIKSEVSNSSEYDYTYVAENGMPVKMNGYSENGELMMSITLSEYSWSQENNDQSDSDDDALMPGFGLIGTIFATTMALFVAKNKIQN